MAQTYTADTLIASIKRKGMIPTSQKTFEEQDFLDLATEEIQVGLLPMLLSAREEFYVTFQDISLIGGQDSYLIPDRAVGRALRDVLFSPANAIASNSEILSLPRIEPDQLPYQRSNRNNNDYAFYLRNDSVVLLPAPTISQGTLRLMYHRRPSSLVTVKSAGRVTAINSTTEVVVNLVPDTFSTANQYDITRAVGGFTSKADDLSITNINTTLNTITFAEDLPDDLVVGDYISLAGYSPVPQLPLELLPVLTQKVVVKCLEALGDPKVQIAQQKLDEVEASAMKLITPRTRGEARKIMHYNGFTNSYWGR